MTIEEFMSDYCEQCAGGRPRCEEACQGILAAYDEERVSMEPQPFCSLPWCGKSFGGEPKRYHVDGRVLEYPEGMDFHHVDGKHKGPGVMICHECHNEHHFVRAIEVDWEDGWVARRPWVDEPLRPLVVAAEWDH